MKVEIDLERLIKLDLTPDEYVLLFCEYYKIQYPFAVQADRLKQDGYLDKELNLTDKAKGLFEEESPESKFNELFYAYPFKTGNGGRVLRPADINTQEARSLQRKYVLLIKNNPGLHEKIMKALKKEIAYLSGRGEKAFLLMFSKWINNHHWDYYTDTNEEKEVSQSGDI